MFPSEHLGLADRTDVDTTSATEFSVEPSHVGLEPFHGMLADIAAVANGDFGRRIGTAGPPPVPAIAMAVDGMRVGLLDGLSNRATGSYSADGPEHRVRGVFDFAVHEFFLIGLALQSLANRNASLADVLQPLVERTDAAIRDLRSVAIHLP